MNSPSPTLPIPRPQVFPITPETEAKQRKAVIEEAMSWIGTPYMQLGNHKGYNIDCSMLLVRCWVDTGVFEPFDPRPYPPEWHLHKSEERYLAWMEALSEEVSEPKPGDVVLFRFGRCFSHGGIYVGDGNIVHAFVYEGFCTKTEITSTQLMYMSNGVDIRPKKYFDIWARLRKLEGNK